MRWLHHLGLKRPKPEQSVAWEIEHHIEELADRLVEEGWEEREARAEAERRFGDPGRYGPSMRRMEKGRMAMERRTLWWDVLRQSSVSVARATKLHPGFTLGVVITLALGIGANATMYGIVDRLLLQPPAHIVDHDVVRRIFIERPHFITGEMRTGSTITYPDYEDLKAHGGLAAVAAYTGEREQTIGSGESARRAKVALASAEFFPLLGVSPAVGRFYTPEEGAVGQPLTAVVSTERWESAYGGDPGVLGRMVAIDGRDHTIIGVAPRGFTGVGLAGVDYWVPLEATHAADRGDQNCLDTRGCWWMSAVARLAGGTTDEAAQAEATQLHRNGRRELIESDRYSDRAGIVLGPVIAARGPEASDEAQVARWLAGVSLVVLLIACANVANLLMARGTRQRREISVRLALGAARRRVTGQLILESVLLSAAGGVVAVALAQWGGQVVRSTLLPGVYFPGSATTPRLLAFTALAALVAGVAAGVAPALQGGRIDLAGTLGDASRGSSAGRSRLRGLLTVTQAALSLVLLVGAGLFVRSLGELRSQDLGLDVGQLLMVRLEPRSADLTPDKQVALYSEAVERVSTLPGVESAAATGVPFGWGFATRFRVPGLDSIPSLPGGGPYYYAVSPGYFETVGLVVARGRPITAADGGNDAKVAVVSETMARSLWPDEDALGKCLMVGGEPESCTTVVGIVEDAARNGFQDQPFMAYYLPAAQVDMPHRAMYVRAELKAGDIADDVARVLRTFSPEVRYAAVQTLEDYLDPQARAWTLGATMFSVFGLLALCLAAIGLYSVLAFDVAQRTRELGIRTALGAEKGRLLRSVLVQGTRMGLLGIALGLAAAYVGAPHVQELLFHVSPRDPWVLGGMALVLVAVSITASLVPGVRATRVNAMDALRSE